MSEAGPALVREQDGPILVVRPNRPEAWNALSPALVTALGAAVLLDHGRTVVCASEDAQEGARAFVEKREPRWLGR